MKTIGLIGGMSWESSLEYYKTVDDVVDFLSWGLSVQDQAGSAVEAVLDGLDLGVGDVGEAGALGEVLADQSVGVLVGGTLPGAVDPSGELSRLHPVNLFAVQSHAPPARPQNPEDGLEQGGLAAAVRTEDADELSPGHREGHVPQDVLLSVPDAQTRYLQHTRHHLELER